VLIKPLTSAEQCCTAVDLCTLCSSETKVPVSFQVGSKITSLGFRHLAKLRYDALRISKDCRTSNFNFFLACASRDALISGQLKALDQLCPTRGPHAAHSRVFCGPVYVFAVVKVYILTTCPYFDNLELGIFDAGGAQCYLSRLLPLQFGFEHFQYIRLSFI